MSALRLPLVVVGLAAAVAACGVGTKAGETDLVGKEPPAIAAEGWLNAEKPIALPDLKGKVVVVEFWATWCPPCRKSIPHLVELQKKHKDAGLVIVSLTNEPKETVEPFAKEYGMSYAIGYGSTSASAYGVSGIPAAFVVGPDGKIIWAGHPMDEEFEKAIERALPKKPV